MCETGLNPGPLSTSAYQSSLIAAVNPVAKASFPMSSLMTTATAHIMYLSSNAGAYADDSFKSLINLFIYLLTSFFTPTLGVGLACRVVRSIEPLAPRLPKLA